MKICMVVQYIILYPVVEAFAHDLSIQRNNDATNIQSEANSADRYCFIVSSVTVRAGHLRDKCITEYRQ